MATSQSLGVPVLVQRGARALAFPFPGQPRHGSWLAAPRRRRTSSAFLVGQSIRDLKREDCRSENARHRGEDGRAHSVSTGKVTVLSSQIHQAEARLTSGAGCWTIATFETLISSMPSLRVRSIVAGSTCEGRSNIRKIRSQRRSE